MTDQQNEPRISVTIGGVTFKNPFYVASGPTTKLVSQLVRIEETGWAAASIKLTIDPAPYINRHPRYGLFGDRHALAFTAERRLAFEDGLELVRQAKKELTDLILMANITYAGDDGPAGWVNMARRFEETGADIIELNMCCPNMSYNLETTSGGSQKADKQTGASMGQQGDVASEIVAAIKSAIRIPLFVKLTPEGGNIAKVARLLYEAGADAVGSTANRLGIPAIDLDHPGRAFHDLQKEISMGCYSGSWLKPLAQRDTYEIRKVCGPEKKIMAAGGITNWRDAVEMVLCGGDLLGVCAETLISGYDIARPMIEGLRHYMAGHGYTSLDQMRDLIVPQVKTATELTLYDGYAHIMKPNMSAPCKSACPHHVPAQAYIQKVAKGEFRDAYDLITGTHAMQEICALACERPCEDACIRGSVDAPLKIRDIKRFVLDYGESQGWTPAWAAGTDNGHRIAVVGSGIAGLTFASEMRRAGYQVTVFEKEKEAGGALRYLTPAFRFDRQVLDRRLEELTRGDIGFAFEQALGVDFTLEDLKNQGYAGVFLAPGAGIAEAPEGTLTARDYLAGSNAGTAPFATHVIVIGDDIDAADAARTAVRRGAEQVTWLLAGKSPSRADLSDQVSRALEEGVRILEHVALIDISHKGVHLEVQGLRSHLEGDLIIVSGKSRLPDEVLAGLEEEDGRIRTERSSGATGIPRVFAGGEAARSKDMISSIASAKQAAAAMDREIRGPAADLAGIGPVETVDRELVLRRHGYIPKDRHYLNLAYEKAEERVKGSALTERVMTEEEAVLEAGRCLNCGCGEGCQICKTICSVFAPCISAPDTLHIDRDVCVACGMCALRCPIHNIEMVSLGTTI